GAALHLDIPTHAAFAGTHHAQLGRLAGNAQIIAGVALDMMSDAEEAELFIGGSEEGYIARWRVTREIAHRQHEGGEAGLVVDGAAPVETAIGEARREGICHAGHLDRVEMTFPDHPRTAAHPIDT